jgi:hypothetical protein
MVYPFYPGLSLNLKDQCKDWSLQKTLANTGRIYIRNLARAVKLSVLTSSDVDEMLLIFEELTLYTDFLFKLNIWFFHTNTDNNGWPLAYTMLE